MLTKLGPGSTKSRDRDPSGADHPRRGSPGSLATLAGALWHSRSAARTRGLAFWAQPCLAPGRFGQVRTARLPPSLPATLPPHDAIAETKEPGQRPEESPPPQHHEIHTSSQAEQLLWLSKSLRVLAVSTLDRLKMTIPLAPCRGGDAPVPHVASAATRAVVNLEIFPS